MSRRHAAEKRQILPDPQFHDLVLAKFMNAVMEDGKKSVAEAIVYGALELLAKTTKRNGLDAFHEALNNAKPQVEVKSRRVGGATYQVPMEVRGSRAQALAVRWLIGAARKRSERTMTERLAGELNDALNNRGAAMKKREETHKMAEANKAFAHFRW
jgi:small subunit ribosomal protein S7